MSLIFEALKKLERERDTTERGFQVIAPAPWPARSRTARVALLSVAAAALGAAGAWAMWTFLSSRGTAGAPTPPASLAAVTPTERPLAPPIWEAAKPAPVVAAVPPPSSVAAPRAAAGVPPAVAAPAQDPAPAASAAAAPLPEWRLEAISAQDGEPVAVINGQLVRAGDTVEGALVTSIGVDSVELEVGGRRRVLTF